MILSGLRNRVLVVVKRVPRTAGVRMILLEIRLKRLRLHV